MKKFLFIALFVARFITLPQLALAQISTPYVFSAGNDILSAEVNSDFSTIANAALKRDGSGSVSGATTVDSPGTLTFNSGAQLTLVSGATLRLNGVTYSTFPAADASGFLSSNGSGTLSWAQSVPSGAVMFYNLSSCPTGWAELTAARGRVITALPGSGTLAGTQGSALADLGTRVITTVPAHTHTIDPPATSTDSQGSHTHNLTTSSMAGATNTVTTAGGTGVATGGLVSTDGAHTHTVDVAPFTSGSTGTASVDVTMPYIQLLACQKS